MGVLVGADLGELMPVLLKLLDLGEGFAFDVLRPEMPRRRA